MRVLKPNPWLASLGAMLAALTMSARIASADVTTDQDASLLVFPKVIADGTRDTLIQISNTKNNTVLAQCFYVNASPVNPFEPAGPLNPRQWIETGFNILLTKQQPTIWRVSTGRAVDPTDPAGTCRAVVSGNQVIQSCPGIDPGFRIPPMGLNLPGAPFEGELKCWEIDGGGAPYLGNSLKGEATIEGEAGAISTYTAIGVVGNQLDDDDKSLSLNNSEYNACPQRLVLPHLLTGGDDPGLLALPSLCDGGTENGNICESGADCPSSGNCDPVVGEGDLPVDTEITIVPCTEDFATQTRTQVNVDFFVYDELEIGISLDNQLVDCWETFRLSDLPPGIWDATRNGAALKTVISTNATSTAGQGILAVAENFRGNISDVPAGSDAVNLHVEGFRTGGDTIYLTTGVCDAQSGPIEGAECVKDQNCWYCDDASNNPDDVCANDDGCPSGSCITDGECR